jgi:hypothetical protein
MKKIKLGLILITLIMFSFTIKKDVITYKNNKLNGLYIEYYSNGNKKIEGTFKDNLRTGSWEAWKKDGTLVLSRIYKKSKVIKYILPKKEVVASRRNKKGFIDFSKVKEKDILWSKRVWRKISNNSGNYAIFTNNLLQNIIREGIVDSTLILYKNLYFKEIISSNEVKEVLKKMDSIDFEYMIKEDWYFNKNTERMEVQIIGISFLQGKSELFTVYFPQLRSLLAKVNVSKEYTLDDLFYYRDFDGEIVKESSLKSKDLTLERIKKIELKIYKSEHYFWLKD